MKYILALLSALIIILGVIFVLNQSKEKVSISADNITKSDNITKAEEIENTAALIKKLKPLVDEVSLKNFQNDDEVYAQYKDKLLMIDTLSEQIIDNIADINMIKDYDYAEYITFRYSIKMDLLSILSVMTPEQYNNLTDEGIAKSLFYHVDLFFTPLASLYDENINVKDYLSAYKEPYYNNEQGMQEYRRQLTFLGKAQKVTDTLNFSENDNKTKNMLMNNAGKSYVLYSINSGLYDNIEQFSQWEIFRNKYIIDDYQQNYLHNLYKYKSVKALKNVYLAKIYMQFMMLDDKYISGLSNIEQMEQEYPEEFYEESTLFVSGCTNPEYLFEDTLNKCVDFIKNAAAKGNCVIVGRCADAVLDDCDNCFNIFISADKDFAKKRVAKEFYMTEDEAADYITKTNHLRSNHYNYYTGRTWGDPSRYDMYIKSSSLGIDRAVDAVYNAVKQKKGAN